MISPQQYELPVDEHEVADKEYELASKLWRVSLLRGLAALALGVWVLTAPPGSPAGLIRAVAVYWIADGSVMLLGSLVAVTPSFSRTLLLLRSLVGIIGAIVILVLPLSMIFGAWQPARLMLLLIVLPLVLCGIALQALAAVCDLLMCLEARRRIPGEWSLGLSATLSILFGVCVVAMLLVPPAVLGRGVGSLGIVGGLAVITGALRLRPARDRSVPALLR